MLLRCQMRHKITTIWYLQLQVVNMLLCDLPVLHAIVHYICCCFCIFTFCLALHLSPSKIRTLYSTHTEMSEVFCVHKAFITDMCIFLQFLPRDAMLAWHMLLSYVPSNLVCKLKVASPGKLSLKGRG